MSASEKKLGDHFLMHPTPSLSDTAAASLTFNCKIKQCKADLGSLQQVFDGLTTLHGAFF